VLRRLSELLVRISDATHAARARASPQAAWPRSAPAHSGRR